jgi:hypothetical protein
MPKNTARIAHLLRVTAAALVMAAASVPSLADVATPKVEAQQGKPTMLYGAYDLAALGYQMDEFFIAGNANSYQIASPVTGDGNWNASVAATAPYATRIVVLRPSDPAKFNGTVLVEWFNVTGGLDTPADWMVAHREMVRKGYAYVGVSAQKVGVEGGDTVMSGPGMPLKKTNPQRYGNLSHPGDAYSFDMFSQAGGLLKKPDASGLLGPLKPQRVLAMGESQSAAFLTTYVNAVDPLAKVYDGFLVHSRFGSSAAIDGTRMAPGTGSTWPAQVKFRQDLRVPVLTVITETDLLGARLSGYHASRQQEGKNLRVWEIPGAAHADNYLFGGAFMDSGLKPAADLARVFQPSTNSPAGKLDKPGNPGMPHHYVTQAALTSLDSWVRSGKAPAKTARMELKTGGKEGETASLATDANGIALGGVRTPWVDVPTVALSGAPATNSFIGMLVGSGEPLDKAAIDRLYPGGKAEYLRKFEVSLDQAIKAGHVLPEDRAEILAIAEINYPVVP